MSLDVVLQLLGRIIIVGGSREEREIPPWIWAMVELLPDGVRGGAGL